MLQAQGADRYLQQPSTYPELIEALRYCIESMVPKESKTNNFVVQYPLSKK